MKQKRRTAKEKMKILEEHFSGNYTWVDLCKKYNISKSVLFRWKEKYKKEGIKGLELSTGKIKKANAGLYLRKPKNKIEELELELLKKDIEIARLKKGYMVKGVGQEKEFVTTFNKNTK